MLTIVNKVLERLYKSKRGSVDYIIDTYVRRPMTILDRISSQSLLAEFVQVSSRLSLKTLLGASAVLTPAGQIMRDLIRRLKPYRFSVKKTVSALTGPGGVLTELAVAHGIAASLVTSHANIAIDEVRSANTTLLNEL